MDRLKCAVPLLLWALLMVPFLLAARAAHPATDDFTFALYTHPTWVETGSILHVLKDALSYTLRTWRDWQGTVTGVFLMTLNPAVFCLKAYGVHAVLLLVLDVAAWVIFLRHMLGVRLRLRRSLWGLLALLLSAIQLMFLPDIVEGIYWFNGAWFYTGAQAVALLTLTLADSLSEGTAQGAWRGLLTLLCFGLLLALGMDNYITAMMTAASLLMMALQRAYARQSMQAKYMALCLLPIGVGLAISVAAPGNAVRMAVDGAHQSGMTWLLSSIVWTLRDAAGYILRFALKTPLLAVLFALTPALCRALDKANVDASRVPPIPAAALGGYLILCAMIIPHMYSSGYAGSGRVVNMYHDYVLLALPLLWGMALARMRAQRRARLAGSGLACVALGAAAFVLCLMGGQIENYVKLVRDQLDGTQAAYIAQFENEYALCEAAGEEDDVALPAWTVQTVTGKPTAYEDASMWTNEAMAQYFGVQSVYVETNAQAE